MLRYLSQCSTKLLSLSFLLHWDCRAPVISKHIIEKNIQRTVVSIGAMTHIYRRTIRYIEETCGANTMLNAINHVTINFAKMNNFISINNFNHITSILFYSLL